MILNLFRKSPDRDAVALSYSAIVAQSRQPRFYADWQVPDTVTGRFDMITLHMALVFRRLRKANRAGKDFSQGLFDYFFKDMDRSLREMGVTDLGVPKKIRNMGNIFYGLLAALSEAMDRQNLDEVDEVLRRNLFEEGATTDVSDLRAYLFATAADLESQPTDEIIAGRIRFKEDT